MVLSLAIYMRALISALAYGGESYTNFPRHSANRMKGVLHMFFPSVRNQIFFNYFFILSFISFVVFIIIRNSKR